MAFHVITAEDAQQCDPRLCAPPVCTEDANVTAIGTAHGRVLPLVGNTRPYLYDVAVTSSNRRIYADKLTDILCVLLGGEYVDIVAQMSSELSEQIPGIERPSVGDLLPPEIAADAPDANDRFGADDNDIEAHQRMQNLLYEAARIRATHAERIRVELQRAINEQAISDGEWELLTDAERDELAASAEIDGGHPIGIPAELSIMVTDTDTGGLVSVDIVRPEWRARTRLVLSTGDYEPWAGAPYPVALHTVQEASGEESEYETGENIVELIIDTEAEYIESLNSAGVLQITERPAHQPDHMFAEMTGDPIVNPYLRRDQSVTG